MTKKPFTTRMDPAVLALAQRLAKSERRSVTAIIELALIEYAERRKTDHVSADREAEE
jgi:hypothetical protein